MLIKLVLHNADTLKVLSCWQPTGQLLRPFFGGSDCLILETTHLGKTRPRRVSNTDSEGSSLLAVKASLHCTNPLPVTL
jgi:hypothetical protein